MIALNVTDSPYFCRTKDILWFTETRTVIDLLNAGATPDEIKDRIEKENLFSAASTSRAKEIRQAILRRIDSVNENYLRFFWTQDSRTQKLLCVIMIMLTDRTFYEFMDTIFREKLIIGDLSIKDSDILSFLHDIQSRDAQAASWTDAGMKKARGNYKQILKDAGLTTDERTDRKILRPLPNRDTVELLNKEGLSPIRKILAGER